jgi:hypothetical protein
MTISSFKLYPSNLSLYHLRSWAQSWSGVPGCRGISGQTQTDGETLVAGFEILLTELPYAGEMQFLYFLHLT